MAVIPGIFHAEDPRNSHAFVQVVDGNLGESTYNTYAVDEFRTSPGRPFWVEVGPNCFSLERIDLDLTGPSGSVKGHVRMGEIRPWPASPWSPGIMGPFTLAPFMQCYHGVLGLDHSLSGSLVLGGVEKSLDGGRGYIERDWGRSFPEAWIWIQTNHFEREKTSLMFSLATVPWLSGQFTGLIAGLLLEGRLYRFTTYGRATPDFAEVTRDAIKIRVHNPRYELTLEAERPPGARLRSPEVGSMEARVTESMGGSVDVLLRTRGASPRTIFEGRGLYAGVEAVGDLGLSPGSS